MSGKNSNFANLVKCGPLPFGLGPYHSHNFMTEKLVRKIAEAIEDKKGKNIVALDMSAIDGAITSAFVICNADSTTQVAAIADGVEEKVREELGEKPWRIEGLTNSVWVAMDYVDVVVHIFQTELRDFYKIEELWADVPIEQFGERK